MKILIRNLYLGIAISIYTSTILLSQRPNDCTTKMPVVGHDPIFWIVAINRIIGTCSFSWRFMQRWPMRWHLLISIVRIYTWNLYSEYLVQEFYGLWKNNSLIVVIIDSDIIFGIITSKVVHQVGNTPVLDKSCLFPATNSKNLPMRYLIADLQSQD